MPQGGPEVGVVQGLTVVLDADERGASSQEAHVREAHAQAGDYRPQREQPVDDEEGDSEGVAVQVDPRLFRHGGPHRGEPSRAGANVLSFNIHGDELCGGFCTVSCSRAVLNWVYPSAGVRWPENTDCKAAPASVSSVEAAPEYQTCGS